MIEIAWWRAGLLRSRSSKGEHYGVYAQSARAGTCADLHRPAGEPARYQAYFAQAY